MATIYTRATKGSALTWAEGDANIENLNNDKIEAVSDDLTPQLGGNLDVNDNTITTTVVDGDIVIAANGQGAIVLDTEVISIGQGTAPAFITTPDNTSDLELNTNGDSNNAKIVLSAGVNGGIELQPNGTGQITLSGQTWPTAAPATNNEYLVADSTGALAWTDRVNARTIYETVKNVSGGSLAKGTPVYQVSVVGNTITVGAARADDPSKLAIGVLDVTLANDAEGRMLVLGEIKGVNTSGFTAGDEIYLGATGGYTNVKPTATDVAVQFLGIVNRVDASNGSGFITGTLTADQIRYNGSGFQFWTGTAWSTFTSLARGSFSAGTGISITDGVIANTQTPGIANVVEDTTPQLGGNLDVNGNSIVSTSNGNINIQPNGTGKVVVNKELEATLLRSTQSSGDEGGELQLALAATNTTLSGGVAIDINQNRLRIFETGGSNRGVYIDLSAATAGVGTNLVGGGGITDIVQDTTPQLGGNLDVNGNQIVSVSNGNIVIAPNGTGKTSVKNITYNEVLHLLNSGNPTSGTLSIDAANGSVQYVSINGNITINGFANAVTGQSITLIVESDAQYTLTSTMLFAGGDKTLTAGGTDVITILYTGSDYLASIGKDFQ